MEIFLDTANTDEIARFRRIGLIDGVTTNPALIAREGRDSVSLIREICDLVDGPVSIEVVSREVEGMIREARHLRRINRNVLVKLTRLYWHVNWGPPTSARSSDDWMLPPVQERN